MLIGDGKGSGRLVGVSEKNELLALTRDIPLTHSVAEEGKAFHLPTGFVTVANTTLFNGMLWITNDSDTHIDLWHLFLMGTQNAQWQLHMKPTGGTLLSSGADGTSHNINLTSAVTADATEKKHNADALTITGGMVMAEYCTRAYETLVDARQGLLILGKGQSIAVSCKPTASGSFSCAMIYTQASLG